MCFANRTIVINLIMFSIRQSITNFDKSTKYILA